MMGQSLRGREIRRCISAVARFAGLVLDVRVPGAYAPGFTLSPASRAWCLMCMFLGLTPQALRCRPLRGLGQLDSALSWGLRPRLYAVARFAGLVLDVRVPGAYAPGFKLSPASRAWTLIERCTQGRGSLLRHLQFARR